MKRQLLTRILASFLSLVILFSDITVLASSDTVVDPPSEEIETETDESIIEDEELPELDSANTDEEETIQTGYFSENEQKYYADSNGILQSGWNKLGDFWGYFDKEQGSAEISSETVDGYWYKLSDGRISYFDKKTTLVQNCWKTINNQKYYFDDEGFVAKGWYQDGIYWYYANEEGQMQKNVITLGEGEEVKNYFFDSNYRLSSGWKKLDGVYRYFNYDENHEKCYEIIFDGTSGWVTAIDDGRKCYIDAKKGAVIGWRNQDGYRYHFDANGFMDTGLFQAGRYHYFAETEETATDESPIGNVAKGARKVGDAVYGFHPTKYYRVSGWQTLDVQCYYFKDD